MFDFLRTFSKLKDRMHLRTRHPMSVNWVACGTCCSVPVNFFQVGGHVDHLRGHPNVVPAVALWLTHSYILLRSFTFLGFGNKFSSKITKLACKQALLLKMVRSPNIFFAASN